MSGPRRGGAGAAVEPGRGDVRKHYVRILVSWAATLAALYALQSCFS